MSSAGARCRRVQLQAPTTTDDGVGGQTVAWAPVEVLWAEFLPLSTREALQAGGLRALVPVVARLPYRATLAVTCRLVDLRTGTTYEVQALRDVDGRQREHELELVEVA